MGYGWARDYRQFVELISRTIEKAKRATDDGKAAEVKIVEQIEEALPWLDSMGVAIFISRSEVDVAKKLAARYPKMRVILFIGLLPEGSKNVAYTRRPLAI